MNLPLKVMKLYLRRISVRLRFFLLATGTILFWLLSGFLVYSLIDGIDRLHKTSISIQYLPVRIL